MFNIHLTWYHHHSKVKSSLNPARDNIYKQQCFPLTLKCGLTDWLWGVARDNGLNICLTVFSCNVSETLLWCCRHKRPRPPPEKRIPFGSIRKFHFSCIHPLKLLHHHLSSCYRPFFYSNPRITTYHHFTYYCELIYSNPIILITT